MTSKHHLCRELIQKIPAKILKRLMNARTEMIEFEEINGAEFEDYICLVGQVVARIQQPPGKYFCDASDAEDILLPAIDFWRKRKIDIKQTQFEACFVQVMITSPIYLRHALCDPRNLLPVIRGYCL